MKKNIQLMKLSQEEINIKIEEFLTKSSFHVKDKKVTIIPYLYKVEDVARKINIHFICKNITNAFLPGKPDVYRIQISTINDIFVYTNKNETMLLCGLCLYKDKWLLVVWNAYRYLNHKTNRSCYVNESTLEDCYNSGYCFSRDFSQESWICDIDHFNLLIRDYIIFTYCGE